MKKILFLIIMITNTFNVLLSQQIKLKDCEDSNFTITEKEYTVGEVPSDDVFLTSNTLENLSSNFVKISENQILDLDQYFFIRAFNNSFIGANSTSRILSKMNVYNQPPVGSYYFDLSNLVRDASSRCNIIKINIIEDSSSPDLSITCHLMDNNMTFNENIGLMAVAGYITVTNSGKSPYSLSSNTTLGSVAGLDIKPAQNYTINPGSSTDVILLLTGTTNSVSQNTTFSIDRITVEGASCTPSLKVTINNVPSEANISNVNCSGLPESSSKTYNENTSVDEQIGHITVTNSGESPYSLSSNTTLGSVAGLDIKPAQNYTINPGNSTRVNVKLLGTTNSVSQNTTSSIDRITVEGVSCTPSLKVTINNVPSEANISNVNCSGLPELNSKTYNENTSVNEQIGYITVTNSGKSPYSLSSNTTLGSVAGLDIKPAQNYTINPGNSTRVNVKLLGTTNSVSQNTTSSIDRITVEGASCTPSLKVTINNVPSEANISNVNCSGLPELNSKTYNENTSVNEQIGYITVTNSGESPYSLSSNTTLGSVAGLDIKPAQNYTINPGNSTRVNVKLLGTTNSVSQNTTSSIDRITVEGASCTPSLKVTINNVPSEANISNVNCSGLPELNSKTYNENTSVNEQIGYITVTNSGESPYSLSSNTTLGSVAGLDIKPAQNYTINPGNSTRVNVKLLGTTNSVSQNTTSSIDRITIEGASCTPSLKVTINNVPSEANISNVNCSGLPELNSKTYNENTSVNEQIGYITVTNSGESPYSLSSNTTLGSVAGLDIKPAQNYTINPGNSTRVNVKLLGTTNSVSQNTTSSIDRITVEGASCTPSLKVTINNVPSEANISNVNCSGLPELNSKTYNENTSVNEQIGYITVTNSGESPYSLSSNTTLGSVAGLDIKPAQNYTINPGNSTRVNVKLLGTTNSVSQNTTSSIDRITVEGASCTPSLKVTINNVPSEANISNVNCSGLPELNSKTYNENTSVNEQIGYITVTNSGESPYSLSSNTTLGSVAGLDIKPAQNYTINPGNSTRVNVKLLGTTNSVSQNTTSSIDRITIEGASCTPSLKVTINNVPSEANISNVNCSGLPELNSKTYNENTSVNEQIGYITVTNSGESPYSLSSNTTLGSVAGLDIKPAQNYTINPGNSTRVNVKLLGTTNSVSQNTTSSIDRITVEGASCTPSLKVTINNVPSEANISNVNCSGLPELNSKTYNENTSVNEQIGYITVTNSGKSPYSLSSNTTLGSVAGLDIKPAQNYTINPGNSTRVNVKLLGTTNSVSQNTTSSIDRITVEGASCTPSLKVTIRNNGGAISPVESGKDYYRFDRNQRVVVESCTGTLQVAPPTLVIADDNLSLSSIYKLYIDNVLITSNFAISTKETQSFEDNRTVSKYVYDLNQNKSNKQLHLHSDFSYLCTLKTNAKILGNHPYYSTKIFNQASPTGQTKNWEVRDSQGNVIYSGVFENNSRPIPVYQN
ncbi:hypothetical protein UJ101_01590 [Flavobacteriaceae bacterium UJ101]|nr:hypothetical protein UJ101_01590 [Flavobacteriaceae bacterium UJ101]